MIVNEGRAGFYLENGLKHVDISRSFMIPPSPLEGLHHGDVSNMKIINQHLCVKIPLQKKLTLESKWNFMARIFSVFKIFYRFFCFFYIYFSV